METSLNENYLNENFDLDLSDKLLDECLQLDESNKSCDFDLISLLEQPKRDLFLNDTQINETTDFGYNLKCYLEDEFGFDANLVINDSVDPDINLENMFPEWSNEFDLNNINLDNQDLLQDTTNCIYIQKNTFPYINDDKNKKRRSLLFENNSAKNDCANENKNSFKIANRKDAALLNHDYSKKKCSDEKFFCPITDCDKMYAKSSHLKAHLRRHSGEKPFVCNWTNCSWKFSRSDELARHKRSHSGIKPYKCELCEKAFARSDHLSKHNKVHTKKMAQYGTYIIKNRLRSND